MIFQSRFTIVKYNFVPNNQLKSTSLSVVFSKHHRKDAWNQI